MPTKAQRPRVRNTTNTLMQYFLIKNSDDHYYVLIGLDTEQILVISDPYVNASSARKGRLNILRYALDRENYLILEERYSKRCQFMIRTKQKTLCKSLWLKNRGTCEVYISKIMNVSKELFTNHEIQNMDIDLAKISDHLYLDV